WRSKHNTTPPTKMDPLPHVIIFPFPAQGHVNSMLKLAHLLSLSNFDVTFLVTVDTHDRLLNHTDVISRFGSGFLLQALPHGISMDVMNTRDGISMLYDSLNKIAKPFLREFIAYSPVTCLIADGILSLAGDVAKEINLPIIYFRTASASSFWSYFCMPDLIQVGELPLKENAKDLTLTKRHDKPLEHEVSYLTHLKILKAPYFLKFERLWQEDESCMPWLDTQPPKSVIYVSFGSVAGLTKEELLEFWYGLVNSEQKFLWVMRPDLIIGQEKKDEIPVELEQGTKARGYMADWVPQEKVLAHRAIGGFLTHSGWNSTLESIVEGVPMICWPRFADQQVNSRFVGEVWKMGLDIKDTCDRDIIAKSIRDLMEKRNGEFSQRTEHMASLAKKAVNEGGSSYINLDRLIQDIRSMIPPHNHT
ncbi:hypothetical protein MTR67_013157, partial [Solanum verrucosum]